MELELNKNRIESFPTFYIFNNQHVKIVKSKNLRKGNYYIKILHSIKKIKNFMQIEPTIRLIDLFGKKTGDSQLRQELLDHLFDKAKGYQHYEEEILNIYRNHNLINKNSENA